MKTVTAPSPARSIPPVAAQKPAKQEDGQDTDLLLAIYHNDRNLTIPRRREKVMSFMQENHPDLLHTLNTLLAKNDKGGSSSVRTHLVESLKLLDDQMAITDETDVLKLSYMEAYNSGFEETLVRAWAIGSVRGEYFEGITATLYDVDFQDGLQGMRLMIYGNNEDKHPNREKDTDYWRGVTALYIMNSDSWFEEEDERRDAHEFIEWAGKQENISLVINLGKERGTFNVSALSSIMDQHDETVPAIRSGVL